MTSIVLKPWGSYEVLEIGLKYSIKRIEVNSGGVLSLQSHVHRSEHWVIVEGVAEVTLNDKINTYKSNESIYIPVKAKHRLANISEKKLVVIEVWYGDILEEEDIIRYEDIYDRK
tara:strand:- start:105 stop:449 length:345 start_codon:yes stop_codon:yes gene_type:complete